MNTTNEITFAVNTLLQHNPWIIAVVLWEAVWKGIALYKAARNRQQFWFIALLVINTVGIFPILYILFFQKNRNEHIKSH
jgi:hypothetical protein